MRRRGCLAASWAILAASMLACSLPGPSIYPLVPGDELVLEPALLGYWAEEDTDSELFTITQSSESSWYEASFLDADCESMSFKVALADLETARFLVLTAAGDELLFTLPTYSFLRVELSPDAIDVTLFDEEWLHDFLESNPEALSHLWRPDADDDNELVLTAPPESLRAFHLEHLDTEGAYEEFERYLRLDEAAARQRQASWNCEG